MTKIHKSYQEMFKHACDFKVQYEFYPFELGGRQYLPHQGIRSDFWYEADNHTDSDRLFMIYPEFESMDGNLIEAGKVLSKGIARMWISNPLWRDYHRERIRKGTIGYFHEGFTRTAQCEVIEIVGLNDNPLK